MRYIKLFEDTESYDYNKMVNYIKKNMIHALNGSGFGIQEINEIISNIDNLDNIIYIYRKTKNRIEEIEEYEDMFLSLMDDGYKVEIDLNPLTIAIKLETNINSVYDVINKIKNISNRFKLDLNVNGLGQPNNNEFQIQFRRNNEYDGEKIRFN